MAAKSSMRFTFDSAAVQRAADAVKALSAKIAMVFGVPHDFLPKEAVIRPAIPSFGEVVLRERPEVMQTMDELSKRDEWRAMVVRTAAASSTRVVVMHRIGEIHRLGVKARTRNVIREPWMIDAGNLQWERMRPELRRRLDVLFAQRDQDIIGSLSYEVAMKAIVKEQCAFETDMAIIGELEKTMAVDGRADLATRKALAALRERAGTASFSEALKELGGAFRSEAEVLGLAHAEGASMAPERLPWADVERLGPWGFYGIRGAYVKLGGLIYQLPVRHSMPRGVLGKVVMLDAHNAPREIGDAYQGTAFAPMPSVKVSVRRVKDQKLRIEEHGWDKAVLFSGYIFEATGADGEGRIHAIAGDVKGGQYFAYEAYEVGRDTNHIDVQP